MSTTPPPPPYRTAQPPVPPPGGYDRRMLRAQRQAAAAQARWQRNQLRMQMQAARRTSVVGPVLLVAVGVILLLLQTGRLHWPNVLTWLGRWWPAVLIGAGLLMLAEWAFDRQQMSSSGAVMIPRRTLGGPAAGLLILLAFLGACVMAAENGSAWARRNLDHSFPNNGFGDWRQVFGVHSDFTQDMNASIAPNGTLTIDDPHGDVAVTGSSQDGQVHVTVHQHIYTWQQDEVNAHRRSDTPTLSGEGAHLTLVAPAQDQDDADLTVEVPHDVSITVRSGHGDVSLEELHGSAEIDSHNGDVKLTGLAGPVRLRTGDDNATISAHSLAGGFTLEGHSGDIDLSDIEGPVTLHGDFFGTTHLEHIRGTVSFQSSFTNFACAAIPGDLNIEGRSDFDAHHLEGPVTLSTTDRNLNLNGVRGGATITDRNGSVELSLAGAPQPVHVTNANGSVEVAIPAGQGFGINARTENGDIQNDFGLTPEKTGDSAQLTAKVHAGGPTLDLQTTEADITLRTATDEDTADWNQAPEHLSTQPATAQTPAAKRMRSAR